jgi:sigma-B regulation protein RsbU (phosphoserine phosphatase)
VRRLLEEFDARFDLTYRVGDRPLGELLERTLSGLDQPRQSWGTEGERTEVVSETGRFVSFYYRPHLFPGMDLKLRLAHELQYRLLPRELPAAGSPVSISSVLESYCHLSGDLFGWEMLRDDKLLIWIADMAGHGLRAGLASAVLRVVIDNLTRRSRVDTLVSNLNRVLHDCRRPGYDSLYATVFAMMLDPVGHTVYCSAGHPPVLVRRSDGAIEELAPLDRPVGLFAETTYQSRELRLAPGSCLLLYTDGLVEATGRDNEPFGRPRLRRLLADITGTPRELTEAIYEEIKARQDIDKLDDDVTFLAVQTRKRGRASHLDSAKVDSRG